MANFNIVNLEQGSTEWLEWRANGIGASEIAVIKGVSPYMTPRQLYDHKKGIKVYDASNFATARGHRLEPIARQKFEEKTWMVVNPVCVESTAPGLEFMKASLDGASMDFDVVVEIKVPGKAVVDKAKKGIVPDHYMMQIQWQMAVCGAVRASYAVYDFNDGELYIVDVSRDDEMIADLIEAGKKFSDSLKNDNPPELSARDKEFRFDQEWKEAADDYAEAKAIADIANERLKEARSKLEALAGGQSSIGAGVRVNVSSRSGSVNYKKIPELEGVDLDQYRGKPSTVVRIDLVDE